MKNFRTIYIIEKYTNEGELKVRRYARNKKVAEKIVREIGGADMCRKVSQREREHINPQWVEG